MAAEKKKVTCMSIYTNIYQYIPIYSNELITYNGQAKGTFGGMFDKMGSMYTEKPNVLHVEAWKVHHEYIRVLYIYISIYIAL